MLTRCSISFQQYSTVLICTSVSERAASGILALGAPWQGRCYPCSGALDQKWIDTSKAPQHAAPMCHPALESKLRKRFYFFPCCHLYCPQKQILLSHLISQTLCRHSSACHKLGSILQMAWEKQLRLSGAFVIITGHRSLPPPSPSIPPSHLHQAQFERTSGTMALTITSALKHVLA